MPRGGHVGGHVGGHGVVGHGGRGLNGWGHHGWNGHNNWNHNWNHGWRNQGWYGGWGYPTVALYDPGMYTYYDPVLGRWVAVDAFGNVVIVN